MTSRVPSLRFGGAHILACKYDEWILILQEDRDASRTFSKILDFDVFLQRVNFIVDFIGSVGLWWIYKDGGVSIFKVYPFTFVSLLSMISYIMFLRTRTMISLLLKIGVHGVFLDWFPNNS